ncbi:MAG: CooT family nickel-binding protein [Solobacterium sp.]|nr:CooT family nickel-binding protein [Solobacterium sp.]
MCLSDVYAVRDGEKKLLFKNVATLSQKGDTLVFSDILGIPNEVKGTITKVDLLENVILIDEKE